MKITDVRTLITFAGWRNFIFVKVFTDEGIVGVGEASLEWNELAVAGAIRNLSPLVIGRDPQPIASRDRARSFPDRRPLAQYVP